MGETISDLRLWVKDPLDLLVEVDTWIVDEMITEEVLLEIIILIVGVLLLDLEDHFATALVPDLVIAIADAQADLLAIVDREMILEIAEIILAVLLLRNACVLDHPKTGHPLKSTLETIP